VAREHDAKSVSRVKLKVGAMAHLSPEHLREHFDLAARGTLAEKAQVEVEVDPDPEAEDAWDLILQSVEIEQ
jgi:hydrogenase nickel incorporation protein HypA/HybF